MNEVKLAEYQKRRETERGLEEREFGSANGLKEEGPRRSEGQPRGRGPEANAQASSAAAALPDLHQVVGFMPKRGDFD